MNHNEPRTSPHPAVWRKSSYSEGQNNCVEVTYTSPVQVRVRDSKLGSGSPILTVTAGGWRALINAIRTGELGG